MSNIKILPRLLVGFGIMVILIAGLSGFAIRSSHVTQSLFQDATRVTTAELMEQRVEKRVTEGRLYVWMALASGDPARSQQMDEALKTANQRLDELRANTLAPERIAMADQLRSGIEAYRTKAMRLQAVSGRNEALNSAAATTSA